jgi:hypothetical protein
VRELDSFDGRRASAIRDPDRNRDADPDADTHAHTGPANTDSDPDPDAAPARGRAAAATSTADDAHAPADHPAAIPQRWGRRQSRRAQRR